MYNTYNISPSNLNYKTYDDLSKTIKKNLSQLPQELDLIVGVPRSGMIPASMISMALSKKLCSLSEFLSETFNSVNTTHRISFNNEVRKVLIVDDSILSGNSIKEVKELIEQNNLDKKYRVFYLAIYNKNDDYHKFVDFSFERVNSPRLFQWNYLNHTFLKDAAFDIDGVLCQDPKNEENDDGFNYVNFILNAKPLFIPQYKIPYLITSRLDKYEQETKQWLYNNNVQYDNLIMLSGYTAEQRRRLNLHAKFKAQCYKKLSDIQLFIESDRKQAMEISRLSGKLCFCATTDELFGKVNK